MKTIQLLRIFTTYNFSPLYKQIQTQIKSKMNFKSELDDRLAVIQEWISENKIGTTEEKTKSIAREMFWCVMNNDIEPNDLLAIRHHIHSSPFSILEGNIWTQLLAYFEANPLIQNNCNCKKYVAFFRDISELTPCGLNTSPNACCGKFELLYRLLRPLSRQPKKGDIVDDCKIFELKGSEVRISDTELTGAEYKKKCTKIFEGRISGNTVKTGGLKGSNVYEIEKTQYRTHYETEFAKNILLSKQLLSEYFEENGWKCTATEVDSMFPIQEETTTGCVWRQDILQKLILQKMFVKYKAKMNFDKMYIFGDGTEVKIICEPEDLQKVQIVADYFRINQVTNVGWYIV
jgi:hypothetical protein